MFLNNFSRLPLLNVSENQENVLKKILVAAAVHLLGVERRAMEVLREATSSACYFYNADIYGLKELHDSIYGEDLREIVDFLLCYTT